MDEQNLTMLYKGKQLDGIATATDCEYTGCTAPTEKLAIIDNDVWQFCQTHFNIVLNAFCRLDAKGASNGAV